MVLRSDDTIAAIATPPGDGAIAVVRLSGPDAVAIADQLFRGGISLLSVPGYTVHPGRLLHPSGSILDQVIVTVYRSPHSYTGEDSVEISCHGGRFLTARVFEALLGAGARAAEPGEFTRRAFMNGKLDLTQAEAVADLIASRSERARRLSVEQLQGKLGDRVRALRAGLVELCSLLELELDFTEEGIELIHTKEIEQKIKNASEAIGILLDSFESGKVIREGITVAIVGPPNVGKSSIFNALLEHDRAIVTHIAGTTRDTIEEELLLDGILFRVSDTAGIRESSDTVEVLGIGRSIKKLLSADAVLLVYDNETEQSTLPPVLSALNERHRLVVVRNKSDLLPGTPVDSITTDPPEIHVSAKTGYGIEKLRTTLARLSNLGSSGDDSQTVSRERHRNALRSALENLSSAQAGLASGASAEFIALDLREAAVRLGEITGEVTTEEILNSVFSSFCIGK